MEATVGGRLRQFREAKGLRQNAFADAADIRQQTLSTIEAGSSVPSYPILQKLLQAYPDLSSDWLLMGVGEMLKGSRSLTPAAQLPPVVPSRFEEFEPGRSPMKIVGETEEVKQLKSERDFLREQNKFLLEIVKSNAAALASTGGQLTPSADAADLYDEVDAIAAEMQYEQSLTDYRIAAQFRTGHVTSAWVVARTA